jgi:hypothetical protein
MSKLFELLQETSKRCAIEGKTPICRLMVNQNGSSSVCVFNTALETELLLTADSEAELIARLSQKLVGFNSPVKPVTAEEMDNAPYLPNSDRKTEKVGNVRI